MTGFSTYFTSNVLSGMNAAFATRSYLHIGTNLLIGVLQATAMIVPALPIPSPRAHSIERRIGGLCPLLRKRMRLAASTSFLDYFRTNITGFSTLFVPMFFSGRSEILLRKPAAAAAAVAGASSVNVAAAAAAAVEQAVEQHQHQRQHSYTDAAAESFLESVGEISASDVVCKKVSFLFPFSSTR